MEVLVDIDERIYVAPITNAEFIPGDAVLTTSGKIHKHEAKSLAENFEEGMIAAAVLSPAGVCLASLYEYVIPRVATLMGRCYVPAKDDKNGE
jgi:hypothetical protein